MTSSLAFRGASSSTLSTDQWTHDVFLNCRSIDTHRNFAAHLYDALDRRGIKTFLAFEPLERGIENLSSLLKTIEGSRISIVVLSQNYASSRWCLDELVKILECKETKGQLIVPVFYKVNPMNLLQLKGSFFDAFSAQYDKMFEQRRVKGWKTALTQVGNLTGWHLDNNSNEALIIDEIVRSIASHANFQVANHPNGIESLVQEPQVSSPPSGSEQGSNSSIPSQGVIIFLIGSVIGLLQLHDLFETHPANMWIAEAALVIFCLLYATMTKINGTRWARYSQIFDSFRVLSGTLVPVSLSSIHLPHQLSWLFYVIWAFLVFIVVAFTLIYPEAEGREAETIISLVPV